VRYIFIFLILANLVLLSALFVFNENNNDSQVIVSSDSSLKTSVIGTFPAMENVETETPLLDLASSQTSERTIDSTKLQINSVGLVNFSNLENFNRLKVENSNNWACVKISSTDPNKLSNWALEQGIEITIGQEDIRIPSSRMVYIEAEGFENANEVRSELIDNKIVKDAFITSYNEKLIVSTGVFKSEASINKLKNNIEGRTRYNTKIRQLYSEKVEYRLFENVLIESIKSLQTSVENEGIQVSVIKNEKVCI